MLHFCPACRNADINKSVIDSEGGRATAECPECATTFQFPYLPLHTLEGASAVGKSTTAGRLEDALDLAIYEGDLHIDLTNGHLSWASICDLDFRICMTLHAADQQTLFVGGVHPHDLGESPETRYFSRIKRCALVCEDADLEERLQERSGMIPEIIDTFLDVNRWYREQGPTEGIEVVNTSVADPDEVAHRVASWVGTEARR